MASWGPDSSSSHCSVGRKKNTEAGVKGHRFCRNWQKTVRSDKTRGPLGFRCLTTVSKVATFMLKCKQLLHIKQEGLKKSVQRAGLFTQHDIHTEVCF